jgi:hypothetical protein
MIREQVLCYIEFIAKYPSLAMTESPSCISINT